MYKYRSDQHEWSSAQTIVLFSLQQSCSFETIIKIIKYQRRTNVLVCECLAAMDAASSRLRLRSATHARTVPHYRLPVAT
jgi:hypothetical protein